MLLGGHDTHHNDIQNNDTQHKGIIWGIQYKSIRHNDTAI